MSLKEDLQNVYDTLPKMDTSKCAALCMKSKKCNFECCTITACGTRERHNINKHIAKEGLKVPFIKESDRMHTGYVLPYEETPAGIRCAYLTPGGCGIYEARPLICRLFGSVKQMTCTHMPEEAKTDKEMFTEMEKVGMLTHELAEHAKKHQGLFNERVAENRRRGHFNIGGK